VKKSISERDREDLIKLNRAMSPEERLVAFYELSQSLERFPKEKKKRNPDPSVFRRKQVRR
jgi:hypothetical protein